MEDTEIADGCAYASVSYKKVEKRAPLPAVRLSMLAYFEPPFREHSSCAMTGRFLDADVVEVRTPEGGLGMSITSRQLSRSLANPPLTS